MSLQSTLLLAFLVVGAIPAVLLTFSAWSGASHLSDQQERTLRSAAVATLDKIDRNLFERYGDAQAFASNPALQNRETWYKPGSSANGIVAAANRYGALYGLYPLMTVVDPAGKLIAANDTDAQGSHLPTERLYQQSYAGRTWLTAALESRFLTGPQGMTGTVVEDAADDAEARQFGGAKGRILLFAAPVKDPAGKVIAVWANRADLGLVDEMLDALASDLRKGGFASAHVALTRREGDLLMERGTPPARTDTLTVAESSRGALGFPGLGWKLTIAVDRAEALALVHALRWRVLGANGIGVLAVLAFGLWMSRRLSTPLRAASEALAGYTQVLQTSAGSLAGVSSSLSQGATRQAAAVEETSAAMHEISTILALHADLSQDARRRVARSTDQVRNAQADLGQLQQSMAEVDAAAQAISRINKTMSDIAFQTNLLALNASVEAARAGAAGAGFAVVATEVRNLAHRATEAARETSSFVASSLNANHSSQDRLSSLSASFQGVDESVSDLLQVLDQVAAGAREQTTGLSQIESALLQIQEAAIEAARGAESSRDEGVTLTQCARQTAQTSGELAGLVNGRN